MLRHRIILDPTDDEDENFNNTNTELNKTIYFDIFLEKSYNTVIICCNYLSKSFKIFINVSGMYLVWICLHYVATHLYVKLCVPSTIIGFLLSPFMTATPHCQGLRWVVYNAANIINNMWVVLGAWICSTFLIVNKESHDTTPSS